ncbi:unnamed protein product [Sphagnum tenellum]
MPVGSSKAMMSNQKSSQDSRQEGLEKNYDERVYFTGMQQQSFTRPERALWQPRRKMHIRNNDDRRCYHPQQNDNQGMASNETKLGPIEAPANTDPDAVTMKQELGPRASIPGYGKGTPAEVETKRRRTRI